MTTTTDKDNKDPNKDLSDILSGSNKKEAPTPRQVGTSPIPHSHARSSEDTDFELESNPGMANGIVDIINEGGQKAFQIGDQVVAPTIGKCLLAGMETGLAREFQAIKSGLGDVIDISVSVALSDLDQNVREVLESSKKNTANTRSIQQGRTSGRFALPSRSD